ncbi:MAG TPA: glycosyltransferase [Prolixibacteraceae bacterium]
MKKSLLFVSQTQFGYLVDYLKYCKYLKDDFDIIFLCWDYKNRKIEEPGIDIRYVSRDGNIVVRNFRFIRFILKCIKQQKFHLVFIDYFRGSSIIPFYCRNNIRIHLDIRTGFVSGNSINRKINNTILRIESIFFRSISIISVGLRQTLGIHKDAYVLPLGATPIFINRQKKQKIHLLYVGTLTNRRIENTIEGVRIFLNKYPNTDLFYTIIGDGWNNENENLQSIVNNLKLQGHITLTGYIPHNELIHYYEKANVGISYIPMTSYYEYQPATKTFEYLMAGMPVIATKTYANKQIVNHLNGILINDNAESFAEGITKIYTCLGSFDEKTIRLTVQNYNWAVIINSMKDTIIQ